MNKNGNHEVYRQMKNVNYGFLEFEMSKLIREFRYRHGVSQNALYMGLCNKKEYFQLESGDSEMDELLFEQLMSRLHVQHRLFDIMLDDDQFDRMECRNHIQLCLRRRKWEQAEQLLIEYEAEMPKNNLHLQYVLANRAEILFQNGQEAGQSFKKALELTMFLEELEKRLLENGVIAENECWMYFRYRCCEQELSEAEYAAFLKSVEKYFLEHQIYPEVYFEATYRYALWLCRLQKYVQCREVCGKAIMELKQGKKVFCLPQILFLDAVAGMRLHYDAEQERELLQQCKQAYYISLSFGKAEMAQKMIAYCLEEFGWHIIEQVK